MKAKHVIGIILFLGLLITIIVGTIYDNISTNKIVTAVKNGDAIEKAIMDIRTSSGEKEVVITDSVELNSIDTSLQKIKEIDARRGGLFMIIADCHLKKRGTNIDFEILLSKYNGWMIVIGGKTFKSDFLFSFIQSKANI